MCFFPLLQNSDLSMSKECCSLIQFVKLYSPVEIQKPAIVYTCSKKELQWSQEKENEEMCCSWITLWLRGKVKENNESFTDIRQNLLKMASYLTTWQAAFEMFAGAKTLN